MALCVMTHKGVLTVAKSCDTLSVPSRKPSGAVKLCEGKPVLSGLVTYRPIMTISGWQTAGSMSRDALQGQKGAATHSVLKPHQPIPLKTT